MCKTQSNVFELRKYTSFLTYYLNAGFSLYYLCDTYTIMFYLEETILELLFHSNKKSILFSRAMSVNEKETVCLSKYTNLLPSRNDAMSCKTSLDSE
jgi:hypothetical protein